MPSHLDSAVNMFKNVFQSGFLSIFYSLGSQPLQIWEQQGARADLQGLNIALPGPPAAAAAAAAAQTSTTSTHAHARRGAAQEDGEVGLVRDEDIHSDVLQLQASNLAGTYVACPADPQRTLGVKLPHLVLALKGLTGRFVSLEVQVLDDRNVRRRFRASNYQVGGWLTAQAGGLCCCVHVLRCKAPCRCCVYS